MTSVKNVTPFADGTLTHSEAELYDRQIRLWGVEAQNRIRASNILIVGISGLGAEIAKNLILAGPRAVTLMDDCEISENDSLSQFLIRSNVNKVNRAEASYEFCHRLNPLVKLEINTSTFDADPVFCAQFNLVILVDQNFDVVNQANLTCRERGIAFIAGGVFGWIGYGFLDFSGREFLITKPKIDLADVDEENDSDQPGPSKKCNDLVTVKDEENEKVKEFLEFKTFASAFDVSSKNLPRRLRINIPRSYFLVKTLLKQPTDIQLTGEALGDAYRHELEANSHYSAEDDSITDYNLFTGPQFGPVCAVIGGFIGQEAIKALSQNGMPLQNVIVYNALDTAYVSNLPPK